MRFIEQTLTSLEVSKMVGREHKEVLRDIRNIINQLGERTIAQTYFIDSFYMSTQNKKMPCYNLTKKGCELYATRMTGEKGTQFAVQYIEKFNAMESTLKEQSNTKLLLKAALEHEEKIETIQSDVNMLKDTMRINGAQEHKLQRIGRAKVVKVLNGKKSLAYKQMSRSVFQSFWNDFKNHFMIPRYNELNKKDFEEAVLFIEEWQPNTTTRIEINKTNMQMTIEDDALSM